MAVTGRVAYGPSGAPLRVPRPSQGGGGGGPALARRGGAQGRNPLGRPSAFRGLEGGRGGRGGGSRRGSPLFSPGPPVPFAGGCRGVGLKVQARPPPTAGGAAPRTPPCFAVGRGWLV